MSLIHKKLVLILIIFITFLGWTYLFVSKNVRLNNGQNLVAGAKLNPPIVKATGRVGIEITENFENNELAEAKYFLITDNGRKYELESPNKQELMPNSLISVSGTLFKNTLNGQVSVITEKPKEEKNNNSQDTIFPKVNVPYDIVVFLAKPNTPDAWTPFSKTQANTIINNGQLQKFIKEGSYNKRKIDADVYGWIPVASCLDAGFHSPEIAEYIAQNSINLLNYKHALFINGCGDNVGKSSVGPEPVNVNGTLYTNLSISYINTGTNVLDPATSTSSFPPSFPWSNMDLMLVHEMGHAFGVWHANGLNCGGAPLALDCTHEEYGNYFDNMGSGIGYSMHYNAAKKEILGWLAPEDVLNVTTSGVYNIKPLEASTGVRLIKISNPSVPAGDVFYTVESRKASGFDSTLSHDLLTQNQNGILINRISQSYGMNGTRLIDATSTPASGIWSTNIRNAALTGDNVFTDPDRGITIGPVLGFNGSSMKFKVTIDPVSTCEHFLPSVIPIGPHKYDLSKAAANPGSNRINFHSRNMDLVTCGSSNFKYELIPQNVPGGLTVSLTKPAMPADYNNERFNYTSPGVAFIPLNTQPGDYSFNIVATNQNFPNFKTTVPIIITVVP